MAISVKNLCVIFTGLICSVLAASNDPKIIFIYGASSQQVYDLSQASSIPMNSNFDPSRKTVLYIHGYDESPTTNITTQTIINAYLKLNTYNILVLDWTTLASGSYPNAVSNTLQLGPQVAAELLVLFQKGLNSNDLHIVGHSLGAQLAGLIGRSIISQSNRTIKLQRITGLDPAFPLYYPPIFGIQHINKNDATLVDIIHTDAGGYGAPKMTGTVDFWPNGGRRFQPGCPVGFFTLLSTDDLCSHHRSVLFWAESVSTPSSTFTSTLFRNPSIKSQMGIATSISTVSDNYKLRTNSMSPFSRS